MKATPLITSILLLQIVSFSAISQFYFFNSNYYDRPVILEMQVGAGGMNCLTDLGGGQHAGRPFIGDLRIQNFRISSSFSITAIYQQTVAFRLEHSRGSIGAADAEIGTSEDQGRDRRMRNLHFRSKIRETAAILELFPVLLVSNIAPVLSPYLFAGIGFFHFNPMANLLGTWTPLPPLSTEGQGFEEYSSRKPYKLTQLCIPVGIGVKYDLGPLLTIRVDFNHRFLFTDYLDDASTTYIDNALFSRYLPPEQAKQAMQLADRRSGILRGSGGGNGEIRGNPEKKDSYLSVNLKMGFIVNRKKVEK